MSAARRPAFDIISHSPDQTRAIGALLGKMISRGSLLLLSGDIGSGKTTFVQGLARALQTGDQVQSPTFTIVAEHTGTCPDGTPLRLYHIHLYRLEGVDDLETVGLDEYLTDPESITAIEWPERGRAWLPEEYLLIDLQTVSDSKRNLRLFPSGTCYVNLVKRVRKEMQGIRG